MIASNTDEPSSPVDQSSRREWLVVGLLMVLALALRLYKQGNSLDVDELLTLRGASQPFLDVLSHRLYPVLYAIEYFFLAFGETEFILRLPSVIAGVLCVPAMHVLGKKAYGRSAGYLSAFLVAASSYHVYHSQVARYYAIVMLLSIVLTFAMHEWIATGEKRYGRLFTIAGIVAVFTQVTVAPYVLTMLLVGMGYAATRPAAGSNARPMRRVLPLALSGALILAPLGMVALLSGTHTLFSVVPAEVNSETLKPVDEQGFSYDFSLGLTEYLRFILEYVPHAPPLVTAGLVLLMLAGFATLWTRRRVLAILVLAQFIAPPLPLFIVAVSHWYESKYFCSLLPLCLLLLSVGSIRSIEAIATVVSRRRGGGIPANDDSGSPLGRRAAVLAIAILLPVVAIDLTTYYRTREFVDWKRVAAYIAPRLQDGDVFAHTGIAKRFTSESPIAEPEYSRGNPVLNYYLKEELTRNDPQRAESVMKSIRRVQAGTPANLERALRRFPNRRIWSIGVHENILDEDMRQALAKLPARATVAFDGCTVRLVLPKN